MAITIAVYAVVRLTGGSDGTEQSGQPASNAAAGTGGGELSQLKTTDFHSMAISPIDPKIILFGHHGGVLRSADGGRTWNKTNLTGQTDDAMGMGISGAEPNVVYAAGHETFFKSNDGGQTWKPQESDLPGHDIHGMAVAPDKAGRLYANVGRYGFYRSDDGGETWTKATTGTYPADVIQVSASRGEVVYLASVQGGVLRSDDGGATFKATGKLTGSVLTVAASASDANTVYAGTDKGLYSSADGGKTWSLRVVPGGGEIMVAAVGPANPLDVTVIAVQADRAGHVFRSTDAGATWQPK